MLRGCFLCCDLLELAVVGTIVAMFMIPMELQLTDDAKAIDRHMAGVVANLAGKADDVVPTKFEVNPKVLYCMLPEKTDKQKDEDKGRQPIEVKGEKTSVILNVSTEVWDIYRCYATKKENDPCFCLNHLWIVVVNFAIADMIVLVTLIDSIFICVELGSSDEPSAFHACCGCICSSFTQSFAASLCVFDLLVFYIFWPYGLETTTGEKKYNYFYQVPITWVVGGFLWGVFSVIAGIESIAYCIECCCAAGRAPEKQVVQQPNVIVIQGGGGGGGPSPGPGSSQRGGGQGRASPSHSKKSQGSWGGGGGGKSTAPGGKNASFGGKNASQGSQVGTTSSGGKTPPKGAASPKGSSMPQKSAKSPSGSSRA